MQYDTWVERPVLITQHCSVFGHLKTEVTRYKVMTPKVHPILPDACEVVVVFQAPRKRKPTLFVIKHDNIRYLTITAGDDVAYDSRTDIPCDMDKWAVSRAKFEKDPALTTITRVPDYTAESA